MGHNKHPETNPHICGKLIFYKDAKITKWGKEQPVQQMVLEIMQTKEVLSLLHTIYKN